MINTNISCGECSLFKSNSKELLKNHDTVFDAASSLNLVSPTFVLHSNIFVGYQGIGKSSTASINSGFIDLESSSFWDDNRKHRPKDWANIYAKIALHLASQGFNVFVSSHSVVREALLKYSAKFPKVSLYTIAPEVSLRKSWITRLRDRFENDPSEKNKAAYLNAVECFETNVTDVSNSSGFTNLIISTSDFSTNFNLLDFLMRKLPKGY